MKSKLASFRPYVILFLLALFGFSILYWYLYYYLHFDGFISDIKTDWLLSIEWRHPFDTQHVPGNQLIIALVRGLVGSHLSPVNTMCIVSFSAFLVAVFLVWRILLLDVSWKWAALGVGLFALWPFEGLFSAVYPRSDMTAIALFLVGAYFWRTKRLLPSALSFGAALVTHKALWVPFSLFWAYWLLSCYRRGSVKILRFTVVALIPILLLWLGGWYYHHSPLWLITTNFGNEIAPATGGLPLLDGLIGTFSKPSAVAVVKGGLLLLLVCMAGSITIQGVRNRNEYSALHLGIVFSVLIFAFVLNRHEIWAVVRFGKLMVIPFCYYASQIQFRRTVPLKIAFIVVAIALLGSQFAWAYYIAHMYFA